MEDLGSAIDLGHGICLFVTSHIHLLQSGERSATLFLLCIRMAHHPLMLHGVWDFLDQVFVGQDQVHIRIHRIFWADNGLGQLNLDTFAVHDLTNVMSGG